MRRIDVVLFSHIALLGVALLGVALLIPSPSSSIDASTPSGRRPSVLVSRPLVAVSAPWPNPPAPLLAPTRPPASPTARPDQPPRRTYLRARSPPPRGATRGVVRARACDTRRRERPARRRETRRRRLRATAPTRVTYPSAGRGSNPARRRRANARWRTIVARNPKTRSAPRTPLIASRDRRRRVSTRRTVDGAAIPDPSPSTGSWR